MSLADYRMTRWGSYADTCNECIENKRAETRYSHAQTGGAKISFSDPEFDGKRPVEVIQLMSRAKRWLEAQGYSITLKGTYTQVKDIKF